MRTCSHPGNTTEAIPLIDYFQRSSKFEHDQNHEYGMTDHLVQQNDTFGFNGKSLFQSYQRLWKAAHEYEMDVLVDNKAVESAFHEMVYFPFNKVSQVFTDSLRQLVSNALGFRFHAYSHKQAEAIERLRYYYPTESDNVMIIKMIQQELYDVNKAIDIARCCNTNERKFDKVIEAVYRLPVNYLWIIARSVINTAKKMKRQTYQISGVVQYLKDHSVYHLDIIPDFEQQLVNDISTICVYSYPHPEHVLAAEKAVKVLTLYYTPVEASKLFVENVMYKLQRYVQINTARLSEKLIEYFRKYSPNEKQTTTLEERYRLFIQAANEYIRRGMQKQYFMEEFLYFNALPKSISAVLPLFEVNMVNLKHYLNYDQPEQKEKPSACSCHPVNHVLKEVVPEPCCDHSMCQRETVDFDYQIRLPEPDTAPVFISQGKYAKESYDMHRFSEHQKMQDMLLSQQEKQLQMTDMTLKHLLDKADLTDEEIKAVAIEINALTEKASVLDKIEPVKDFNGETTFAVFSKDVVKDTE